MTSWPQNVEEHVRIELSLSEAAIVDRAFSEHNTRAVLERLEEVTTEWERAVAILEASEIAIDGFDEPESDVVASIVGPSSQPVPGTNRVVYSMDSKTWKGIVDQIRKNRNAYQGALAPYRIVGANAAKKLNGLVHKIVAKLNSAQLGEGDDRRLARLKMWKKHNPTDGFWEDPRKFAPETATTAQSSKSFKQGVTSGDVGHDAQGVGAEPKFTRAKRKKKDKEQKVEHTTGGQEPDEEIPS